MQRRDLWMRAGLAAAIFLACPALGASYYGLSPIEFVAQGSRVVGALAFSVIHSGDLEVVQARLGTYHRGPRPLAGVSPKDSWAKIRDAVPGLRIEASLDLPDAIPEVPFIYESSDAPHLRRFRERYPLSSVIAGATGEYPAMLALGGWLGRQFDHGADPLIGSDRLCEPAEIIADGQRGKKYWCEVAARTTVQAATALGWPARVTTVSRDGYVWDHAVAELWSSEFRKWFVLDTDFNVVYELDDIPQSAHELMRLSAMNRELAIRHIAPAKPGIPDPTARATLSLYKYVHVDMRNDWCSRRLPRGSPAGGDRATWWSAQPSLGRLLTARRHVADPGVFDWPVGVSLIHAVSASPAPGGAADIEVALAAVSSGFDSFEVQLDRGEWTALRYSKIVRVGQGSHLLRARLRTLAPFPGPESTATVVVRRTST